MTSSLRQSIGVCYQHPNVGSCSRLYHPEPEKIKKINDYVAAIADLRLKVSLLQQRHEAAKRDTLKWEELCGRLRSECTDKLRETVEVKEAISRMYRQICARRGVRAALEGDYEGQLGVIKKALLDYRRIREMAIAAKKERECASMRPCCSKDTR